MTQTGKLLTVMAGLPQTRTMPEGVKIDLRTASWTSGIYKSPVSGPVWVGQNGLTGDGQADLNNHGGPYNDILAYDADHYPQWRDLLGLPQLELGAFGENFAVAGFTDETVCIGDIWRVGPGNGGDVAVEQGVLLQVSQPRQPCWKLARRIGTPEVVKITIEKGWGGWYLRVLKEGYVAAGMTIECVSRPHPEWPVRTAVWTMYERKKQREQAARLAVVPEISVRWRRELVEG
ncbi:MAG: MOSC domain-containing protein [Phycisphaerae bacterium]